MVWTCFFVVGVCRFIGSVNVVTPSNSYCVATGLVQGDRPGCFDLRVRTWVESVWVQGCDGEVRWGKNLMAERERWIISTTVWIPRVLCFIGH